MSCKTFSPTYNKKRYIVFGIVTILALIIPFITVDGNHLFLLSFDKMKLNIFFAEFNIQELLPMPFLLMTLFLGIFFMTTLGGRVWCGWACPQTIFRVIYRDLLQTKILGIRKSIKNKQKEPTGQGAKRFIGFIIWVVLSVIAASNFLWYFVPPEDFFNYLKNPADHVVLIGFIACMASFLTYTVVSSKEDFCIYVCPYARVQSVMFDDDTIQTVYNPIRGGKIYDEEGKKLWKKPPGEEDECTGCEACVKVCPTHIDIRKGMQLECINCLECADACTKVMGALGKPSLITWTSEKQVMEDKKVKYFRFRTIAYIVALCITSSFLAYMSGHQSTMQLNINRTTQLYEIRKNGSIENAYTFLFENTDKADHKFYFEVSNPDIKIKNPRKPFMLKAGQKIKKPVVLSTVAKLADSTDEDKPLKITIKAFAVDAKDKINILKPAAFIYPKQSIIDKKLKK